MSRDSITTIRMRALFIPPLMLLLTGLLAGSAIAQQTIYVNGTTGNDAWDGLCEVWDGGTCGPKATIQAGIDAATNGDTVLVADGTYTGDSNKNLRFYGKAIIVRSANGPESCVIDCEGNNRGFNLHDYETVATIIDGFTVTGGYGGVACMESSPTFQNCVITGNTTEGDGGGILCIAGSPTIKNCMIAYCMAKRGGGVFCRDGSEPVIIDCLITENTATQNAGGLMCNFDCNATLDNCVISNNRGNLSTGGLCFRVDCGGVVNDCLITDNWSLSGGGVTCIGGTTQFTRCEITGNSAEIRGGGIYVWYSGEPEFRNSRVTGNQAPEGGGLYCTDDSLPSLVDCTLAGNSAASGRAVYCDGAGAPSVTNSILWNGGDEIQCDGAIPTVRYSDVYGGWEGAGNINDDPLFIDPGYWDDNGTPEDPEDDFWVGGDYHLQADSPCIDAGDPAFVPQPLETDLDGMARVWDGDDDDVRIVDMGAYEYGSRPYGDMNCDGIVNAYDIDGFIMAVSSYPDFAAYYERYPDCDPLLADAHGDGIVNAYDIDPFIDLVAGG
ncbi:MAG: right-handed parallel beta-helix repeat-containing protein [Planctomycetota bacterium]